MIACLGTLVVKGLNYGLDFTGGTMMQVQFKDNIDIQDIRKALSDEGLTADIQTFVGKNAFSIKVKGGQENVNEVADKIEAGLKSANVDFEVESRDFVGPTVGSFLAKKALFAFVLAMSAMIIYIGFRFQNIIWGAMAVVALFHDVFLAVGVFSFFQFEIDLVIVAALLTIAGFTVNSTIVVFDRVRENIRLNPKWDLKDLLNLSVNETLSRTVITSLTVISATAILYFVGGGVLKNFSLAILIGLISGIYTTVCLVTGLVYQWSKGGNYSSLAGEGASVSSPSNDGGYNSPKKKNKKRHG
jgi:preprotein translocase subunit SecF